MDMIVWSECWWENALSVFLGAGMFICIVGLVWYTIYEIRRPADYTDFHVKIKRDKRY
jgi:hypothetical protein